MTPLKSLSQSDSPPEAVALTVPSAVTSRTTRTAGRRTRSFADTAQLVLAVVMLAVLAGLIYISELDSIYWTNIRITSFVQRTLGIRRSVDHGSSARARQIIVVAENDENQRLIAKTTLERYGYAVALADNGAQAEALLRQAGPRVALVLLDREALPDSARDTILKLKSIQPNVRILMSQAAREDNRAVSGAADFIERPFSSMPLAEAVRKILAIQ